MSLPALRNRRLPWVRSVRGLGGDPWIALAYAVIAVFLCLFLAYPLLRVFLAPSPADWARLLASPRWASALRGSLLMTLLSTSSSVAVGYVYAYAIVRGRVPAARILAAVPLLFLVAPPFVGGLAFTLLLGRQGLITHALLGLDLSIYGWQGLWLAQTLSFFPIPYLMVSQALKGLDPGLEQAARSLGSGPGRIFRTVTLPLTVPAIVSSSLFVALSVLSDFGTPMLVAGRFRVLATEVYTQMTGWASSGASAAAGISLLVPAALIYFAQRRIGRGAKQRYATVGGGGSGLHPAGTSRGARIALFAFCLLFALFVAADYLVILFGSAVKVWGVNAEPTMAHYAGLRLYGREIADTIGFAALAAILCALLSATAAYLARCRVPLAGAIEAAAVLPAALPHTLIGLAYVIAFNGQPFNLTGSGAIIVIAMAVCYFPFGYRSAAAAMDQLKTSLDDGARSLGASRTRLFFDIVGPLTRRALGSAFAFAFIISVGTMSAVIFLVSFKTPLASVTILNLAEQGSWGDAAALASLMTLLTFAGLGLARFIAGKESFGEALR
jgi:iron(III) transport system permease protein